VNPLWCSADGASPTLTRSVQQASGGVLILVQRLQHAVISLRLVRQSKIVSVAPTLRYRVPTKPDPTC
jgi:hypothetical protein